MNLYTIGFTKKSAEEFFTFIGQNGIEILIDVRLRNNTQLAGFTKGNDLAYFLKIICNCLYTHEERFAPYKELLDGYKKGIISWDEYEMIYTNLYHKREMGLYFKEKYSQYNKALLLCSEPTPEHCHRRLLAECIRKDRPDVDIIHL